MYLMKLSDRNQELLHIDHTHLIEMMCEDNMRVLQKLNYHIWVEFYGMRLLFYFRPLKAIQVNSKLRICLHSDMWTKIIRP